MITEQKVIKNKVGLLTLAQTLGNVSQALSLSKTSSPFQYLQLTSGTQFLIIAI